MLLVGMVEETSRVIFYERGSGLGHDLAVASSGGGAPEVGGWCNRGTDAAALLPSLPPPFLQAAW